MASRMDPKQVWDGQAGGQHWELHVTRVDEGPPTHEAPDGELIIIGPHRIAWRLTLTSQTGERLELWWDPEERVLGGAPLRGWDKSAISALKRHLAKRGKSP